MKPQFTILAMLLFVLGGPLGLMQYHSRAAFIEPTAYPLLSKSPEPQLIGSSVGELLFDLRASRTMTLDCSFESVGKLGAYYEAQRHKWFACLYNSEQTPGLIKATASAIAKSWTRWQPTLVALPEPLAELRHRDLHKVWRARLEAYALAHEKAAGKADVASVQKLASAIGGSVVDRLGAFCDSHFPKWLADQLKPAPIPGLLAATSRAIGKSGIRWQRTLVSLPERLNQLRKQDIFTIWQRRFEPYAVTQLEATTLAGAFSLYEADNAETIEPGAIIASRTPLPAMATFALGTLTSDLGIVATVPLGRAVAEIATVPQSPILSIAKLAEPALWRPALLRAIGNLGRISVHNR